MTLPPPMTGSAVRFPPHPATIDQGTTPKGRGPEKLKRKEGGMRVPIATRAVLGPALRCAAALSVAAAALWGIAPGAWAEFKVGAELPEFSFKAADGATFSLQRQRDRVVITHGPKRLDPKGVVRFAQVGYGQGDEKVWREDVGRLLAGKPVAHKTITRQRLRVGERLPVIELPSVRTGKAMGLTGAGGRLTFRDDAGKVS